MTVYINGTTGYSGPVGTIGDLTTTGNTTLGDASGDTLTINGSTTTLTQGTANGVAYLNGSKALTTGTALVFDGTNLGVGAAALGTAANRTVITVNGTNDSLITMGVGGARKASMYHDGTNMQLNNEAAGYLLFSTSNTERMRLDASGNLGLGVTPSAWNTSRKVLQGTGAALMLTSGNNSLATLFANTYENTSGVYTYQNTAAASYYQQYNGAHSWYTAASGTAGNAISFTQAMTLDASGNLALGTTSAGTRLEVVGTGATLSGTAKLVARFVQDTTTYRGVVLGYDSSGQIGIIYPESAGAASNLAFWTYSGSAWAERVRIAYDGSFYPNQNGGAFYPAAAGAYAALTNLGNTATVQVQQTQTGTGAYRYVPMISQTTVSPSGYRQHTVIGSSRGTTWGDVFIAVGGDDNYPTVAFYFSYTGVFTAPSTKNFVIPHPLPELNSTQELVHAAIEAPRADLIYRGVVQLVDGQAVVNVDADSRMTEGTFDVLCRNVQCFTTNESDWTPVRGAVSGNVLTIQAQDPTSQAQVSWMVIGERKDENVMRTYDEQGRFIVERLAKQATPT